MRVPCPQEKSRDRLVNSFPVLVACTLYRSVAEVLQEKEKQAASEL